MDEITRIINRMNFYQREDGLYQARLTVKGKRRAFYGKTKVEIKQKAQKYLEKIENGYIEPKKIVFNEYAIYWLETYKFNRIEPSSYSKLYQTWEHQIKDSIGHKKIGEITREDIQELIDSHARPENENIVPLAMSGLKRLKQLLNSIYKTAIAEQIVSENPCIGTMIPTHSYIVKETKEQESMTDEEIELFKEACLAKYKWSGEYKSRDRILCLIMLCTGLRVGEMLALNWNDIDYKNKQLIVNKTIQSNVKDYNYVKTGKGYSRQNILKKMPKTKAGIRIIPLNDDVLSYFDLLKEYDKRKGIETEYVCCTSTGARKLYSTFARSLRRMMDETKEIKTHVSHHTLRHTFGSTLLRRGVPIEVVSRLMGHANIKVTYDKYIHVLDLQKAQAMLNVKIV